MFEHLKLRQQAARAVAAFGICAALCLSVATPSLAKEALPSAADPALEKRTMDLAAELRCLVCQNQTIADSDADLAVDLRNQVRRMLGEGQSERDVLDFMTARYGDFVLYRPPVKSSTALLWFGPPVLLVVGMLTLWTILRRRSRMSADNFDPDEYPEDDFDHDYETAADSPARRTPAARP